MKISPLASLEALHPPSTAFAACSRWQDVRLVYRERWQTEAISGAMISCLGAMPAICHANAATEVALDFLRTSGLEPPARIETYSSNQEAAVCAGRMAAAGFRLATAMPPSPEIRALEAQLVAPALYDFLNDKRNIGALCKAAFIPARRIHGRDAVRGLQAAAIRFPVFLKGAVEGASGGGLDVRICADEQAFGEALSWFESKPAFKALIIETAVPFTATWCLNFAVLDRDVRYLGAAEQLFAKPGRQSGSLIDPERPPPPLAIEIGKDICFAALARGYRGLAGLDMCIDAEEGLYFFDLNFRMTSSTCFILLHGGMGDPRQVGVTSTFTGRGRLEDLLPRLADLAGRGLFTPTQLYDGGGHDGPAAPSLIGGFCRGNTRQEAMGLVHDVGDRLAAPPF